MVDGPALSLIPIDASGNPYSDVKLIPKIASEIDSSNNKIGTANATVNFPVNLNSTYYTDPISSHGAPGFRLSTILSNGAFFFWECYLSDVLWKKNFISTIRTIGNNTAACLIELSYWPPASAQTVGYELDFDLVIGTGFITELNSAATNNQTFSRSFNGATALTSNVILESTNLVIVNTTLVNYAYGTNNQTYNITSIVSWSPVNHTTVQITIRFPFTFYPSLYYDPDIGVLLGSGAGSSSAGGNSGGAAGGGDGFNNAYIAAIVVPVVLLVFAVVVIISVIVGVIIYKKVSFTMTQRAFSSNNFITSADSKENTVNF